jgi:hypothetical protein
MRVRSRAGHFVVENQYVIAVIDYRSVGVKVAGDAPHVKIDNVALC